LKECIAELTLENRLLKKKSMIRDVASGCDQANVVHRPRLLSDNGSSYISGDLKDYIKDNGMRHVRGAPYHL